MSDPDSDTNSDLVVETADQRFIRLIDEHDREFKQNLRALTNFSKILADDHARSIKELKRACKDYVTPRSNDALPLQDVKHGQQSLEENNGTVQEPQLPPPRLSTTVRQLSNQSTPTPMLQNGKSPTHDVPQQSPDRSQTFHPDNHSGTENSREAGKTRETLAELAVALDELAHVKAHNQQAQVHASDVQNQKAPSDSILPRLGDDDDDDSSEDIMHEESDDEDQHLADDTPLQPKLLPKISTKTPKQTKAKATPGDAPKSRRSGPKNRWSDEEEDRMINILYTVSRQDTDETKTDMWRRVETLHRAYGYDRSWDQMAAKWSMQTRDKCETRGLAWAKDIMKKIPHISRKRRALSPGEPTQGNTSLGFKVNRARKKSKKFSDTDTARSSFPTPSQPLGLQSDLQLQYTFNRASSAIVQVDWSPDGKHFAVASNSRYNEGDNFSDNEPRNLLYGSISTQTIRELPEHRIDRGNIQPKYVYTTVSAVKFSKTSHRVYSGGYDDKVRVWNVENEHDIQCKAELLYKHKKIEVMDVTGDQTTILATGTNSGTRSIRVFIGDSDLTEDCAEIRPLREMGFTSFDYSPTCLRFGKEQSRNRLIAGFGQDANPPYGSFGAGRIAVWEFSEARCVAMDFEQGNTFVSDCSWSAFGDSFVVGAVADPAHKQESWENSVVKLYSTRERQATTTFSCRARDINDVTFDFGLVTASCTDGSTYVWDRRNSRTPLHVLTHGDPVTKFQTSLQRELNDVGVRYVEWTGNSGRLYTGGSDGALKLWDTRRSPADVLLQDVAQLGDEILCGKLSPDQQFLLLGDEDGRLHLFGRSKTPLQKKDFAFMMAERWAGA